MGYKVGLAGESHCQEAVGRCKEGQRVYILHELNNPYDERALIVTTESGAALGYVPRDSWLQTAMHDEGKSAAAKIATINRGEHGAGVVIDVTLNVGTSKICYYEP